MAEEEESNPHVQFSEEVKVVIPLTIDDKSGECSDYSDWLINDHQQNVE